MLSPAQTKSLRKLITQARNAFADRTLLESEGYGTAVLRSQEAADATEKRLQQFIDKITNKENE